MKNIIDVLRQKEAELQQLQNEVEVLRVAASLLSEQGDPELETFAATGTDGAVTGAPMGVARKRQFP
jgi:hypothetical protein